MPYLFPDDLTILIVTYGDHRKYLVESLQAINKFSKYIENIIIVQNGIEYDLNKFVDSIGVTKDIQMHLLCNRKNLGSAGGFRMGIEEFLNIQGKKLLIMDDDSYIPENSFSELQQLDMSSIKKIYGDKIAISMYRPYHDTDKKIFKRDYDNNSTFYDNTVYRFSVMHKFHLKSERRERIMPNIAENYIVPYSGLVVERKDLLNIEKVDTDYFVYGDDSRFTARLSQSGVRILTLEKIYSKDLEYSWYQNKDQSLRGKNVVEIMLRTKNAANIWRPFYQVRNGVCNSRKVFKKNSLIYWLNFLVFLSVPFFAYMPKNKRGLRNYRFFVIAVLNGNAGKLGQMGKHFFYK